MINTSACRSGRPPLPVLGSWPPGVAGTDESTFTTTPKAAVAVLPEASLAAQVMVFAPTGRRLPDDGVQTTVTAPELSVALGIANSTGSPDRAILTV